MHLLTDGQMPDVKRRGGVARGGGVAEPSRGALASAERGAPGDRSLAVESFAFDARRRPHAGRPQSREPPVTERRRSGR